MSSDSRVPGTTCPAGVCRPPLATTTGLTAAVRRARRVNFRGLPRVSRYIRATSVASSSYQYWRMSLPETSARFPAETKDDRPSPRRSSAESRAIPIAPDCVNRPVRPRTGIGAGVSEALSSTSGAVLITP